jgi:hypothetical protein
MWFGDEYISYIEDLEEKGYTLAYSIGDIEKARQRYEHMLANKLFSAEENT